MQIYHENVPKDQGINSVVMRISATDIDDGLNRKVKYALNKNGTDYNFFEIDSETGVVRLANEIMVIILSNFSNGLQTCQTYNSPKNYVLYLF